MNEFRRALLVSFAAIVLLCLWLSQELRMLRAHIHILLFGPVSRPLGGDQHRGDRPSVVGSFSRDLHAGDPRIAAPDVPGKRRDAGAWAARNS